MRLPTGRWRRILLVVVLALAVVLAASAAYYSHGKRGYRLAQGIYLVDGGQACLWIAPSRLGQLRSDGTAILGYPPHYALVRRPATSVSYWHGGLTLRQGWANRTKDPSTVLDLTVDLKPSTDTPGDWDATEVHVCIGSVIAGLPAYLDGLQARFTPPHWLSADFDPGQPPLLHFLHRVNDARLVPYMNSARGTTECLGLIRGMAADYPDDVCLQMHRIDMEARYGDLAVASDLWTQWGEAAAQHPDRLLRATSHRVHAVLERASYDHDYPEIPVSAEVLPPEEKGTDRVVGRGATWDLDRRMAWLTSLAATEHLACGSDYLMLPPGMVPTEGDIRLLGDSRPNFVEHQALSKEAGVASQFLLLQGRREESLELLLGNYRMGQNVGASETVIGQLIGANARAIAILSLHEQLLNACETESETQVFLTRFRQVRRFDGFLRGEFTGFDDMPPLLACMTYRDGLALPDEAERSIRCDNVNAQAAVLEAAAAAKLFRQRTGRNPGSAEDFAQVLPDGLPRDPHAQKAAVRWALVAPIDSNSRGAAAPGEAKRDGTATDSAAEFTIYSVGPDRTDGGGRVEYDSSNGTTSAGDILLRIPREREFPFPDGPVHAASADELRRQFPNGLPRDVFAWGSSSRAARHFSLAIVDATTTRPVTVFSVGPDQEPDPDRNWPRGGQYPDGARVQPVFRYGRAGATSVGPSSATAMLSPQTLPLYVPEPNYEPTNGTKSGGNLILELPR
jgi:hypothetical protein